MWTSEDAQRLESIVHDLYVIGDEIVCALVLLKVERPADIECQKKHEVHLLHFFDQKGKIVSQVLTGFADDVERDNQIVSPFLKVGAKVTPNLSGRTE